MESFFHCVYRVEKRVSKGPHEQRQQTAERQRETVHLLVTPIDRDLYCQHGLIEALHCSAGCQEANGTTVHQRKHAILFVDSGRQLHQSFGLTLMEAAEGNMTCRLAGHSGCQGEDSPIESNLFQQVVSHHDSLACKRQHLARPCSQLMAPIKPNLDWFFRAD